MKSITTAIFFIYCCIFITACDLDGQRQLDLQYPVTLEILNRSPDKITVLSIYNSADTTAGFVLKGNTIPHGQSIKLNISESTADAISYGKYFIEGTCEKNKKWLVNGKHLNNSITHNEHEWIATITVKDCEKGDGEIKK